MTSPTRMALLDAVTWNNLGHCQKQQGMFSPAIASFDKAIQADPDLAVAHCNRAVARFQASLRAGQPISSETMQAILKACNLEPERADFHFHAASIFAEAMKTDASHAETAVLHLRRAYELDYPRKSQLGVPRELLSLLPPELLTPDTEPLPPPAVLYASPPETAELGGFSGN